MLKSLHLMNNMFHTLSIYFRFEITIFQNGSILHTLSYSYIRLLVRNASHFYQVHLGGTMMLKSLYLMNNMFHTLSIYFRFEITIFQSASILHTLSYSYIRLLVRNASHFYQVHLGGTMILKSLHLMNYMFHTLSIHFRFELQFFKMDQFCIPKVTRTCTS